MKTPERIELDLKSAFATQLAHNEQERLWARIETALDEAAGATDQHQRVVRSRLMLAAVALTLCAAAALFSLSSWLPSSGNLPSAPLVLNDRSAFTGAQTVAQTKSFDFEDGSRISLHTNSQIDVLAMTGDQVLLRLIHGSATFQVKKGGLRKWRIEAGVASVEVVGTRFSVTRKAEDVQIVVNEGRVLVRSAQLVDGVARLDAGETIAVTHDSRAKMETSRQADPSAEPSAVAPLALPNPSTTQEPAPRQRAAETIENLLSKADQARLTGDLPSALVALEGIVRRFPNDARAPLSSFQLGRIHQKQNNLTQAERAYKWTIEHSSSATLKEDCYVRLIETQLARNPETAKTTAQVYLNEFPLGRHVRSVQAMLERVTPAASDTPRLPN